MDHHSSSKSRSDDLSLWRAGLLASLRHRWYGLPVADRALALTITALALAFGVLTMR